MITEEEKSSKLHAMTCEWELFLSLSLSLFLELQIINSHKQH